MELHQQESEGSREPRYDAAALRKVTALAEQLQARQGEALTAAEIESIGSEVGLRPAFVRQALALLDQESRPKGLANAGRPSPLAWAVSAALGLLAFLMFTGSGGWAAMGVFFTAAILGAAVVGYRARGMRAGFFSGALPGAGIWLAALAAFGPPFPGARGAVEVILYLLVGSGVTGLSGLAGSKLRQRRRPLPTGEDTGPGLPPSSSHTGLAPDARAAASHSLSREQMVELLFALQQELEGQKLRRAFLSVDVVGSSEMKESRPELAVEYSFTQFRRWVEETARAGGLETYATAGDGLMCVFSDEGHAARAVRQLLEGLPQFNIERNQLSQPFRIRCGISAGLVAFDPKLPLGHLHSAVIDRAATLQKRAAPGSVLVGEEAAAGVRAELPGDLSPLGEPTAGEKAFVWQPGGTLPSPSPDAAR